jgi:hypothetical protein
LLPAVMTRTADSLEPGLKRQIQPAGFRANSDRC